MFAESLLGGIGGSKKQTLRGGYFGPHVVEVIVRLAGCIDYSLEMIRARRKEEEVVRKGPGDDVEGGCHLHPRPKEQGDEHHGKGATLGDTVRATVCGA